MNAKTKVFCTGTTSRSSEEVILAFLKTQGQRVKDKVGEMTFKTSDVLHKCYLYCYVCIRFGMLRNLSSLPQKVLEFTTHMHTHSRSHFSVLCVHSTKNFIEYLWQGLQRTYEWKLIIIKFLFSMAFGILVFTRKLKKIYLGGDAFNCLPVRQWFPSCIFCCASVSL